LIHIYTQGRKPKHTGRGPKPWSTFSGGARDGVSIYIDGFFNRFANQICKRFLPTLVRTYNAGLSFALLFFLRTHFNQNTALLSNFTMLSAYCNLHHCLAALTGSFLIGRMPAELQAFYGRRPACIIATFLKTCVQIDM
jgi:hypothetical protein